MTITLEMLNTVATLAMSVLTSIAIVGGFIWGLVRRIRAQFEAQETRITKVEDDARLAVAAADSRAKVAEDTLARSLAEHKLYAAEHFATEEGLSKAMEPVLRALEKLTERIDKLADGAAR